MSRNIDGLRVATCIFEAACFHKSVLVECGCGHSACFQPHGLWWLFERRGWSDEFRDMPERFYCTRCLGKLQRRVRPGKIVPIERQATITLPMPDEYEWKRALSRYRS